MKQPPTQKETMKTLKRLIIIFALFMLVTLLFWCTKVIAQERDTVLFYRINKDSVVIAWFEKNLFDSVQQGLKGKDGYCPPIKTLYLKIKEPK